MTEFTLGGRRFIVERPGTPLQEADMVALERAIGTPLPTPLRNFYLRVNGGLPCPADIPDDKSVWVAVRWAKGGSAAGAGPAVAVGAMFRVNADADIDFLRSWNDFKHRIPKDCLCFAGSPGGSLYLIGTGAQNRGKIYYWARRFEADVAAGETPGYDNVAEVADSFPSFLLALREEPDVDEELDAWVKRVYSS